MINDLLAKLSGYKKTADELVAQVESASKILEAKNVENAQLSAALSQALGYIERLKKALAGFNLDVPAADPLTGEEAPVAPAPAAVGITVGTLTTGTPPAADPAATVTA